VHLATLTVENYRALRTASVGFDDTTVQIGENDCGKSSLLEALAIALDPEAGEAPPHFQPHHLHCTAPRADAPAAGPIRISLRFRERRPGEWDGLADTPLGGLLQPAPARRPLSGCGRSCSTFAPPRQRASAKWLPADACAPRAHRARRPSPRPRPWPACAD
jgi:energy-coupling factor transporter ATP-binding protein EcfA2